MTRKITINSIDHKENYVKIIVNPKVYSLKTIYAAGYVFLDKTYILLDQDKKNNIEVYLFPKEKKQALKKLGLEFCNELLNYAHYFSRAKVCADTVKTIMQRALFSASPTLVEEAKKEEKQKPINELEKEKDELAYTEKKR